MKQQPARSHPIELVLPVAVALLAAGLLVGGFIFHSRTVYYTETIQPDAVDLSTLPEELRIDPWTSQPIEVPQPEPEIVERTTLEPEYRLVLEVTRGGVLLVGGKIRRQYEVGQAPPSQCPT
jgi:hypothetical protein